jgi:cell division protein FtsB
MNTTVITDTRAPGPGTRAPRRQAPRRGDPRRGDPRRGDPRRLGRRRHDPGRAPAEGLRTRQAADPSGAARRPASRTPFILLVLALLGCGLVCLLVVNTTLAAASFRISNLQQENAQASQRVQELQQQVSADRSANSIQRRALRLGMRLQPTLNFIDLRTGRRYTAPLHARGVYAVPGYTP